MPDYQLAESRFQNLEQLKQAIVEWFALSQRFSELMTVSTSGQWSVGCSVSYKRMVNILNTKLSSLDVFTIALLFRYRR